ncbi:sugar phosphate isomerase/epimerase [Aliisedimentitalea scapharcae]|uniref:Sugar phosphate isomerase/epimerase n=1 Tax=Aliisedimentitalea scapharcae TaxID=1524259 RepID=A0ABZ2Y1L3_9RHOB
MIVDTTIHSFSLRHHFAHQPGFDAIAFADLARSMGFQGISLSLNDASYRHLGGCDTDRMDRLRAYLVAHGMSLEVDTSDTAPAHMSKMLNVAHRMGATSLRTYTRHGADVSEMMQNTSADLAAVVHEAHDLGVIIVLENHEDFTGPELADIVEQVNHPNLKILYDYGNSQMVLEDPIAALDAVLPHVHSIHFKDHVMIRAQDAGQLTVAGVPVGDGFLPLADLTRRLLDQGLRRFTFENVWAYSAPIQAGRKALKGVSLGDGAFAYLDPPFDPARVILRHSEFSPQTLVDLERQALHRGHEAFRQILKTLGASGDWES